MRLALSLFSALCIALALSSSAQISTGGGVGFSRIPQPHFQRVTTGAVGATSSAVVTLTWTIPFTDANYTVTCDVEDSTAATASLSVLHVESKVAASVGVRVNNTSAGPLTGTLGCIAIHD